ncbi:MAG TPA: serine/threonine-protein kinase [Enhygromyxa sp.]|nr:serine/threonine-protein kinase [Enhygromyxa sp.]
MRDAPGDLFEADSMVAHRYRVIGYRGDRGFGQVYEAHDSAMNRRVGLMRLRREFSQPDTRDSFYETRSTAAVEDPRIVDLSDYGEDVDGRLFLVMPWIDRAETLDVLLARAGAFAWPRAKSIIEQIAGALEAAHRKGVLHGGLEPSRVLIDEQGRVHIVDFGLAPALTRPGAREVTLTGPLPGKIEYLSPEQVRGEAVDARTDIYALGVIFWELITGKPPFVGGQVEVADAHLEAALPKLAHGGPTGAPNVEPLLQRALAKRPDQRLPSAAEFLEQLAAIPFAEPTPTPVVIPQATAAPDQPSLERSGPPPRKRKLGKLELALIGFLAFDVLLFASWKLLSRDAESTADASAMTEQPLATAEPEPQPPAQPAAAEPPPPTPIEPAPLLSVEEAIAAELPAEPDGPGPIRPGGKSLSDKVFREAMVAARDEMLDACMKGRMRRTLKIALRVAPSGQVEYARVVGSLGKTALGQCVAEHVYRIKFPITHEGGSHTYTMRLR